MSPVVDRNPSQEATDVLAILESTLTVSTAPTVGKSPLSAPTDGSSSSRGSRMIATNTHLDLEAGERLCYWENKDSAHRPSQRANRRENAHERRSQRPTAWVGNQHPVRPRSTLLLSCETSATLENPIREWTLHVPFVYSETSRCRLYVGHHGSNSVYSPSRQPNIDRIII